MPRVANHPSLDQRVVNPRSGKLECVAVNLEAVYPDPQNPRIEFCFEELRAAKRGWLERDWRSPSAPTAQSPVKARVPLTESPRKEINRPTDDFDVPSMRSHAPKTVPLNDENDENVAPSANSQATKTTSVRKSRVQDDDNKTRKIRVRELKNDTQTSEFSNQAVRGSVN